MVPKILLKLSVTCTEFVTQFQFSFMLNNNEMKPCLHKVITCHSTQSNKMHYIVPRYFTLQYLIEQQAIVM
jgi:hypothetical protein